MIAKIPKDPAGSEILAVVEALVGDDLKTMQALFARNELRELRPSALVGEPTDLWLVRALAAMDHGLTAVQIVTSSLTSRLSVVGEMSAHWQTRIDAFANLRASVNHNDDPRVTEIIDAGVEHFTELRVSALADERQRRVFGSAGC